MQLSSHDLSYLAQCAASAAVRAGQQIERFMLQSFTVHKKPGGESDASQVVTEVDWLSEKIIINQLKPSCEQYDLALLSEEQGEDKARLYKPYFWCVDPIDGTLSFVNYRPGFSVSIALVANNGTPVLGVVYDPVTHMLYTAVQGQGVLRNGKPWNCNFPAQFRGYTLSIIFDPGICKCKEYVEIRDRIQSMAKQIGFKNTRVLVKNGAVMNACWVVQHAPACYIKFPKPKNGGGSLWDFAATAAIFNELGLHASDIDGQPLDLNRPDSTFMNHRGVLFTNPSSLATMIRKVLT